MPAITDSSSVGSTISQTMARNLPLTDPARGAVEVGVRSGMVRDSRRGPGPLTVSSHPRSGAARP